MTTDTNLSTSDLAGTATSDAPAVEPGVDDREDRETSTAPEQTPLFAAEDSASFRERWQEVQTGFVDEPRQAVERADELVADLMKRLAQTFADERANLEAQWGQGENVGTEELRVALQRYRSFFERLLAT
jgi:hypothetical protein